MDGRTRRRIFYSKYHIIGQLRSALIMNASRLGHYLYDIIISGLRASAISNAPPICVEIGNNAQVIAKLYSIILLHLLWQRQLAMMVRHPLSPEEGQRLYTRSSIIFGMGFVLLASHALTVLRESRASWTRTSHLGKEPSFPLLIFAIYIKCSTARLYWYYIVQCNYTFLRFIDAGIY